MSVWEYNQLLQTLNIKKHKLAESNSLIYIDSNRISTKYYVIILLQYTNLIVGKHLNFFSRNYTKEINENYILWYYICDKNVIKKKFFFGKTAFCYNIELNKIKTFLTYSESSKYQKPTQIYYVSSHH